MVSKSCWVEAENVPSGWQARSGFRLLAPDTGGRRALSRAQMATPFMSLEKLLERDLFGYQGNVLCPSRDRCSLEALFTPLWGQGCEVFVLTCSSQRGYRKGLSNALQMDPTVQVRWFSENGELLIKRLHKMQSITCD